MLVAANYAKRYAKSDENGKNTSEKKRVSQCVRKAVHEREKERAQANRNRSLVEISHRHYCMISQSSGTFTKSDVFPKLGGDANAYHGVSAGIKGHALSPSRHGSKMIAAMPMQLPSPQ